MPLAILAPLLLAATPVVQALAEFYGMVEPAHALRPLLLALAIAGGLLLLFRLRLGDGPRAALVSVPLVALAWWPGPLVGLFHALADAGLPLALAGTLAGGAVAVAVVGWGGFLLGPRATPARLKRAADFVGAFCAVLLGLTLVRLGRVAAAQDRAPLPLGPAHGPGDAPRAPRDLPPLEAPASAPREAPDIFWIVLDAYAREDVLRRVHGLDNQAFYRELEARGFYRAREATSNYALTTSSLGSTLNLAYLDPDPQHPIRHARDYYGPLATMIRGNRLARFLDGRGYRTAVFSTGYFAFDHCAVDEPHDSWWNSLENLLLDRSLAGSLSRGAQRAARLGNLLAAFEGIPAYRGGPEPSFVLAHVSAPHPPFVLGAEAQPVDPGYPVFTMMDLGKTFDRQMGPGWYSKAYREQLLGVNKLVLRLLDRLRAAPAPRPLVVVLQGDHGSGSRRGDTLLDEDMIERYRILSAYYFSDGPEPALYPGITPVNSGRVLLRRYFGADLPLLEDRTYLISARTGYGLIELPRAALRLGGPPAFLPRGAGPGLDAAVGPGL